MTKISFHTLPINEKTTILQQVSNKQGLAAFAVEKDWWVVQTLTTIFDTPDKIKNKLFLMLC